MNTNINKPNSNPLQQAPPIPITRLTTILGSFMEVLTHQILYTRSLYPHDAFSPTRYYGVACHACRHPGVVDYIYDTLKVAIPGIVSGRVDGVYLIIYDEGNGGGNSIGVENEHGLLERFVMEFDLDDIVHIASGDDRKLSGGRGRMERDELDAKIQELERSLRDVLLKVVSLDGTDLGRKRGRAQFPPSATFKLCLHTPNESSMSLSMGGNSECDGGTSGNTTARNQQIHCPELDQAITDGAWFRADSESCSFANNASNVGIDGETNGFIDTGDEDGSNGAIDKKANGIGSVIRPLKSVNVPSCGLRMQLMAEFPR